MAQTIINFYEGETVQSVLLINRSVGIFPVSCMNIHIHLVHSRWRPCDATLLENLYIDT